MLEIKEDLQWRCEKQKKKHNSPKRFHNNIKFRSDHFSSENQKKPRCVLVFFVSVIIYYCFL